MVWPFWKKFYLIALIIFLIATFWGLSQNPPFFSLAKAETATTTLQTSVIIIVCGNGVVEIGETCDDGASNTNYGYYEAKGRGYCLTDCSGYAPYCGDGTVQSGFGEECDDGNRTSGDGCSSSCQTEAAPPPSGGGGGGAVYIPPPEKVTKVVLQGKAYPSAVITVLQDGKVVTTEKVDSGANFKVVIKDITPGVWTFGLWAEDKEGRRSITFSFTTTVTKDMTTTVGGIFIPPTIELKKIRVARGETLDILGQTAPKSEVSISVESPEITKKTEADEKGDWDYPFDTSPLTEGSHTTRAKAETPEGLLSSYSKVLGFYVGKFGVEEICPKADFNKDGKTNLVDFSIMLYWWGKYNPAVDQNQNGIVDLPDFSILMYWWTG